jgi:hypothetical protein
VDDIDVTKLTAVTTPVGLGSDSAAAWSKFAPGSMFAGRFRIVAPLGRGGIGEVYRADDLKLEQPVALKFLPQAVAADAARLAFRAHRRAAVHVHRGVLQDPASVRDGIRSAAPRARGRLNLRILCVAGPGAALRPRAAGLTCAQCWPPMGDVDHR